MLVASSRTRMLLLMIFCLLVTLESGKIQAGVISVATNTTLDKTIAINLAKTLEEFSANNSISALIEPQRVDNESATFNVYLAVKNETQAQKKFSVLSEELKNKTRGLQEAVMRKHGIWIDFLWTTDNNELYENIFDETRKTRNHVVLALIMLILLIVTVFNLLKYWVWDKKKEFD